MRSGFCIILLFLFMVPSSQLLGQDDLMDIIDEDDEESTNYTMATFKTTRLINGHSIETPAGGVLQFMISHRFGRVTGGFYDIFGLDNATIRLGFDYGITDRLNVGVGRSSFEKTYDGFVKYKLLRQSTGKNTMPFSTSLFASTAIKGVEWPEPERPNYFTSRMYYVFQALIARKFTSDLSLQLMPSFVHRNLVETRDDKNDVFALGVGGRYKVTGSLSINAEYYYIFPDQIVSGLYGEDVKNSLAIGVDIETGGHVFQLQFTNSRGMAEKFFITETTGSWLNADIHFGFNIHRVFTLVDKSKANRDKR